MQAVGTPTLPEATIEDLLSWKPCYDEDEIREIAGERERFTALDVLGLDIPFKDALWVVLRPELIDGRTVRLFACWCVRHTPIGDGKTTWNLLDDERSRHAVEVAERYAHGEATDEELNAARSAARIVAWSAAWSAAESAAWSAQRTTLVQMLKGAQI
jgi:hypothetical protein